MGALLLWCMGNFPAAVANSGGTKKEAVEFFREARAGDGRVPNMQAGKSYAPFRVLLAYTAEEQKERILRRTQPPAGEVGSSNSQPPPASKARKAIIGGPEPEDYLTANSAELRLLLVQLLGRVNALQRRQHSLFSRLTDAEKHELAEANEKLTALKAMLKARCSVPSSK